LNIIVAESVEVSSFVF